MTDEESVRLLIAAAERMDRWLFQTCRSSRFRRLLALGLPAQDLHEALEMVRRGKRPSGKPAGPIFLESGRLLLKVADKTENYFPSDDDK